MAKRKPGQIALDAIDASLVEATERVDCFTQRNSLPIEKKALWLCHACHMRLHLELKRTERRRP
jgi:hypothetical protein